MPFSLYPLALAEWRCAFVLSCGVQEICRTCSTSLGPGRALSHWPYWTGGLCAGKMRAAEASSQNTKAHLQFRDKDVMWDSVKCLALVQVHGISCSSFSHQIWQAQFASCPQSPLYLPSLSIVFKRTCSMILLGSPLWASGVVNVRLFLSVYTGPHLLVLPGQVLCVTCPDP